MAQDIVSGLFGLSPYQVEQQQNAAYDKRAQEMARMGGFELAGYLGGKAGLGVGKMAGGMLGLQDPAVAEAQQRQAALQGLDISSPESILARAQQIQDPKLKMQLMMVARDAQAKQQQLATEAAKMKLAERKQDFQETEAMDLKRTQVLENIRLKEKQIEQEAAIARAKGESDAAYKAQLLELRRLGLQIQQSKQEGPAKLSPTAQKELFEADEAVMGASAGVKALQQALAINKKAMGGKGSGVLADIGSVLPDAVRPEMFDATQELDNIVQNSVLPQMKSIFGTNPTEGERKILLDISGSSSKPWNVREGIFNRAMAAAENRAKFNEKKAAELRGGSYFAPKAPEAPTEAKSGTKPSSGMPSGSIQIGTTPEGEPVYQSPDGRKWVQ